MWKSKGFWVCLVGGWMIGSAVFACPTKSEFDTVVGGIKIFVNGNACKDPCSDTGITGVVECDDLAGVVGGCVLTRCTLNSLRYVTCVEPANAGSGESDCEYHWDNNDWWRWIIVRTPDGGCTDGNQQSGNYGGTLCSADGNGNPSWWTPCISNNGCTGPIFMGIDRAEPPLRRPRCGP